MGFAANASDMREEPEEGTRQRGLAACGQVKGLQPDASLPARPGMRNVSFLNFIRRFLPGGFCYLGSRWGIADARGISGEGQEVGGCRVRAMGTAARR